MINGEYPGWHLGKELLPASLSLAQTEALEMIGDHVRQSQFLGNPLETWQLALFDQLLNTKTMGTKCPMLCHCAWKNCYRGHLLQKLEEAWKPWTQWTRT